MGNLEQRLQARIRASGPVTYEEFIGAALYDEQEGYYRKGKPEGCDFLTSPEVHNAFGESIARYVMALADARGLERLSILELGGGAGRLGRTIMANLDAERLDRYIILERKGQRGDGKIGAKIEWISRIEELPVLSGFTFVVANEFFDALPFRRVLMKQGELKEIFLGFDDGFIDIPLPLPADLDAFIGKYPLYLTEYQTIEVTPMLAPVISGLSSRLEEGVLLIFDYGYHLEDIAFGAFFDGSMVSYCNYTMTPDVFSGIGKRDISHHVNFDHLAAILGEAGWKKGGETRQYRFLNACSAGMRLQSLPGAERRTAMMLLDPDGMGSAFRVLGFSKGSAGDLPGF